jgi:autotransporter-associated beta strand protein
VTATSLNLTDTPGTAIRFNAGTNITVAAGNHKIVGTGLNNGTAYDVIFNGASNSSHTFDIASGASFEIQGRIHHGASNSKDYFKTGDGTLILAGANGGSSSWTIAAAKSFQIQGGALRFASTNAAGHSSNNYTVSSGAAIELSGGFSQTSSNGTITLNGTGIGGNGALRSLAGSNSIGGSGSGGIELASNSSIGVDAGASLSIAPIVKGTGALTKVGEGTLTLSVANTYTGGTTIQAGTLTSGNASSLGSNTGSLTLNGGTLNLNNNDITVGNLAGTGGTIQGGVAGTRTLTIGQGNATGGNFQGVIANGIGTTALAKTGSGTLTLSGNNSYTGTTTISQGILQIGNGGTTGTLGTHSNTFIASGAELRIDRSTDNFGYSYTGALSGDGRVNILSSRRFNFQTNNQNASGNLAFVVDGTLAINTGSGVTSVHFGELSGSGVIQRAGTAPSNPPLTTLTVGGKNTNSTYSGNISSVGEFAIDKVGSGTLTLSGTSSHGGGTTVSAGTLLVNGSLGNSAVTVDPLAIIGGTGTIGGSLSFAGNSFLHVVDLANALAVTGSITFGSGFGIAKLLGINWDDLALNTPHTVLASNQDFSLAGLDNFGLANATRSPANRTCLSRSASWSGTTSRRPSTDGTIN